MAGEMQLGSARTSSSDRVGQSEAERCRHVQAAESACQAMGFLVLYQRPQHGNAQDASELTAGSDYSRSQSRPLRRH